MGNPVVLSIERERLLNLEPAELVSFSAETRRRIRSGHELRSRRFVRVLRSSDCSLLNSISLIKESISIMGTLSGRAAGKVINPADFQLIRVKLKINKTEAAASAVNTSFFDQWVLDCLDITVFSASPEVLFCFLTVTGNFLRYAARLIHSLVAKIQILIFPG